MRQNSWINSAIAQGIDAGWESNQDLWPDLALNGLHVVINDLATQRRDEYVLGPDGLTHISPSYDGPFFSQSGYDFWTQENAQGITLTHDGQAGRILSTVEEFFHETFHHYEQVQ